MSKILRKLFNLMEDPEHPSVGPQLRLMYFLGIWDPNKPTKFGYRKFHMFWITLFFITIYIRTLFFDRSSDALNPILKYVPFHIGMLKVLTFKWDHEKWEDLINYVSRKEREQLSIKDAKQERIIKNYISHNRAVTYFFWGSVFCADFMIFTEPYSKTREVVNGTTVYVYMFDGYTPFDREPPGYHYSMAIQVVVGFTVSAYILAWDALVVCVMIFFAGQLKLARYICATNILDERDQAKSHRNIVEFHQHYITLIKYQVMFNSMISSVMFVYLLFASINLGVCTIQIVALEMEFIAVVWSGAYVMAILLQMLLFYWHSNEVTVESQRVTYGLFKSEWSSSNNALQKELILLGFTTRKRLIFNAGPFTEMSLYVFTGILRGTYSFYTLLSGTA